MATRSNTTLSIQAENAIVVKVVNNNTLRMIPDAMFQHPHQCLVLNVNAIKVSMKQLSNVKTVIWV